jgi:hypothetical protein
MGPGPGAEEPTVLTRPIISEAVARRRKKQCWNSRSMVLRLRVRASKSVGATRPGVPAVIEANFRVTVAERRAHISVNGCLGRRLIGRPRSSNANSSAPSRCALLRCRARRRRCRPTQNPALQPVHSQIDDRCGVEGQHLGQQQAADDGHPEWVAQLRARAALKR